MSDSGQPATDQPGPTFGSGDPFVNLSAVQTRMDSLHRYLVDSTLSQDQLDRVSSELASAIHDVIINGAALLSFSQPNPVRISLPEPPLQVNLTPPPVNPTPEADDGEIVEIDAVELLAEHIHFCEICGKGFKRDANLRMHMRAHGDQFKTLEALSKPEKSAGTRECRKTVRFSCPYIGCNRNKQNSNFRALKSAICVKNHFKRSHCPKMYSCNRCHKKSFSVVADLKSHQKYCGDSRWKCSCGTSFSRKDKLFSHIAIFDGHMPAVAGEVRRLDDSPNAQLMQFGGFGWTMENGSSSSAMASNVDDDDFGRSLIEEYLNF